MPQVFLLTMLKKRLTATARQLSPRRPAVLECAGLRRLGLGMATRANLHITGRTLCAPSPRDGTNVATAAQLPCLGISRGPSPYACYHAGMPTEDRPTATSRDRSRRLVPPKKRQPSTRQLERLATTGPGRPRQTTARCRPMSRFSKGKLRREKKSGNFCGNRSIAKTRPSRP
jgi:hypothetical protein